MRHSGVPTLWLSASLPRSDGYLYDSSGNKIGRLLKITRNADDDVPLLTEEGMASIDSIWNRVVREAAHKKLQFTDALRILVEMRKGALLTASDLTGVVVEHGIRSPELVKECLDAIDYKETHFPSRAGILLSSSQLAVGVQHMVKVNNRLKFNNDGPFNPPHYETDSKEILRSLQDTKDNVEPLMKRIMSAVKRVPSNGTGLAIRTDGTFESSEESIDLLGSSSEKKNGSVEVDESIDDEEVVSKNGGPAAAAAGGGNHGATLTDMTIEEIQAEMKQIESGIASLLEGRNEDDVKERYLEWGALWKRHEKKGGMRAELDAAIDDGWRDDYNTWRQVTNRRRTLEKLRLELAVKHDSSVDREAMEKRSKLAKEISKHEEAIEKLLDGTTEGELRAGSSAYKKWDRTKRKAIKDGTEIPPEPPLVREQMNAITVLDSRRRKLAKARQQLEELGDGLALAASSTMTTVTPVSSGKRKADNDNSTSTNQAAEPPANNGDSKPAGKKKRACRKKAATEDQVMQSAHPIPPQPLPPLPLDHVMAPLSWSMEGDDTPVDTDTPTNTASV